MLRNGKVRNAREYQNDEHREQSYLLSSIVNSALLVAQRRAITTKHQNIPDLQSVKLTFSPPRVCLQIFPSSLGPASDTQTTDRVCVGYLSFRRVIRICLVGS